MKTVAVTGASGDIGRAICLEFAKNGYNVAALYNTNDASATALIDELCKFGVNAKAYKCDLTDESAVNAVSSNILADLGHIDTVINNAGISFTGLVTDFSGDDFDKIFSVNVKSMFMLNNALLPHMINRKSGEIINISSIWGVCGASCEVLYSATKSAIIGYTKALAAEVGPSGIRVNCIAPGFIDTKMNDHLSDDDKADFANDTPLCRLGSVDDVAKSALFLANDSSSFITGQVLGVNGGYIM